MNATGKRMRWQKGLNRHELHKAQHAHKRPGKDFHKTPKSKEGK
jgi:hypothetical protein